MALSTPTPLKVTIQHTTSLRAIKDASNRRTKAVKPNDDFFWVNESDNDGDPLAFRAKQSFIRARYHGRRKEIQSRNLEISMKPFPFKHQNTHFSIPLPLVVARSPQLGIVDSVLSTPSYTDQDVNLYFHHYKHSCSKDYLPLDSQKSEWLMRLALSQPALLQILLALGAFHRAIGFSLRGSSPRVAQSAARDGLQLRCEAIKALRRGLGEPHNIHFEAILATMIHLTYVEGADGNTAGIHAHMKGIKEIIQIMGGIDSLDHRMVTIVYGCDLLKGLLGSPLEFYISPNWEHKIRNYSLFLNQECCTYSSLGSSFFSSPWSCEIHPVLARIIQSLRQIIPLFASLPNESPLNLISNEHDYIVLLAHTLLSLGRDQPIDPFQDTLRRAIQVYMAIRMWKFEGMACAEKTVDTLRRSLASSFTLIQNKSPDLLFWILFMGCLGTKQHACYMWFWKRLEKAATELQLLDWDDAVSILEGFFFVRWPTDEQGRALWNAIAQRHKPDLNSHTGSNMI